MLVRPSSKTPAGVVGFLKGDVEEEAEVRVGDVKRGLEGVVDGELAGDDEAGPGAARGGPEEEAPDAELGEDVIDRARDGVVAALRARAARSTPEKEREGRGRGPRR